MIHILTKYGVAAIENGRWYAASAFLQAALTGIGREITMTPKDPEPDYARATYVVEQIGGTVVSPAPIAPKEVNPDIIH